MTNSTVTKNAGPTSVLNDLDIQWQLLDLYEADLSSISLWRCVVECRRALEAVGLATTENVETLASYTVQTLLHGATKAARS